MLQGRGRRPDRRVRPRRPPGDHRVRDRSGRGRTRPRFSRPSNRIWTRPSMESRIDDAADLEEDEPSHVLVAETEDAPIIRLVDAMISQATEERASDIHIEPSGERVRIRFRVDGVLHDASSTPRSVLRPVVSRLKVMAGCDISNSRTPQDGRFSVTGGGREVDVRMTTLPTSSGEAVVLRLLDKSQRHLRTELARLRGRRPRSVPGVVPHVAGRDPRRRTDRLGQDLHALRHAGRAQRPRPQHRERRGPGRVPHGRHQAGAGRPPRHGRIRRRAARDPAGRPRRDPGR